MWLVGRVLDRVKFIHMVLLLMVVTVSLTVALYAAHMSGILPQDAPSREDALILSGMTFVLPVAMCGAMFWRERGTVYLGGMLIFGAGGVLAPTLIAVAGG